MINMFNKFQKPLAASPLDYYDNDHSKRRIQFYSFPHE